MYSITVVAIVVGQSLGLFDGDFMPRKKAIFDQNEQQRLLACCKTDTEFIIIWTFMNTGIHPSDFGKLKEKNIDDQNYLEYHRVKNDNPLSKLLSPKSVEKLKKFLRWNNRPKSRTQLWQIVHNVGKRAGFSYLSPLTLRKTFCIELLRKYKDHPQCFDIVSKEMGCTREVVIQNYLDLQQWKDVYRKKR